jgi:hypothetical protein
MCYGNCFKLQLGMMSGKQNRYSIIATSIDIQDDFFWHYVFPRRT